MGSWILDALPESSISSALEESARRTLRETLSTAIKSAYEDSELLFAANAIELSLIEALDSGSEEDINHYAFQCFSLLRTIDLPDSEAEARWHLLRTASVGFLSERTTETAKLLREKYHSSVVSPKKKWDQYVENTVVDVWLRLFRKNGWDDFDQVLIEITELRTKQEEFEKDFLNSLKGVEATENAWKLVALYHLAHCSEILATYLTQGNVDSKLDIRQQLDAQFDRVMNACNKGGLLELSSAAHLLRPAADRLISNSIWYVARGANQFFKDFLKQLQSRSNESPLFEFLPPQRVAIRKAGLIGGASRSVVVNLPTSSGKTLIAEFRILQAIFQFNYEKGWVAYLAPTRALVHQVATRLRKDFSNVGINVEEVSPALEVDNVEAQLLQESRSEYTFRVLVTTPEKFDFMIRGGWEERIGRPLTLVVVDEAHNIANGSRGVKLELLLSTINRECENAQFLLLTPFIRNSKEVAKWLAPDSHNETSLSLHWQPNDRVVGIVKPKSIPGRGNYSLDFSTVHTTHETLEIPEEFTLTDQRNLGLNWSDVKSSLSNIAAATAYKLKKRGSVIVLARTIPRTWSIARKLTQDEETKVNTDRDIALVRRYISNELGNQFGLSELLNYGVAVHHSGLPDDIKRLVEWLFEAGKLDILVATTTIAQGVNFPVSSIVLATHQYPGPPPVDLPAEDFWNLAGRAGRVKQGSVGTVVLAANSEQKVCQLKQYLQNQVRDLNSSLISMVEHALNEWGQIELHRMFNDSSWSAFLQYLSHTYRQIGDADRFSVEIEQVLRGTLGFQKLRERKPEWSKELLRGVRAYGERISGKPLALVDATGFSWESVSQTLREIGREHISSDCWDRSDFFSHENKQLPDIMGVLLTVPELKQNLIDAVGGPGLKKDLLARIVVDWVNGESLTTLTGRYFKTNPNGEQLDWNAAMSKCCRNLFGKLTQTTSWGLAALQSLTVGEDFDNLSDEHAQRLRNLPAKVYYGVENENALALRMLDVPRQAATTLSKNLDDINHLPLPQIREKLINSGQKGWTRDLGAVGEDYFEIWKILSGAE